MADTQVKFTSPPKSSVEDSKKHLMNILKNMTKYSKDKISRDYFDSIRDYDALNANAIKMFSSIVDSGFLDEARELFKPLPDQVTLPEVAVYTMVIWTYAGNGNIKDAHKVYKKMIASGVTPTTYTYTALISGLARDFSNLDSVGYAKKYFVEMLDRGMKPHSTPYLKLMNAIACQETEEEANKFLEQIKAKGLSLDHYSFPYKEGHITNQMQVIRKYTDLVHNNNIVHKYVEKMLASPWKISDFAMKMHCALLVDGNANEDTIQPTVTEPSVVLHTLVIESFLKSGKAKGALRAYWGMLASGIAPNSYTYTILIKGLAADPVFSGDAKKCLLEMMEKGMRPNAATYTAVIESFAKQCNKVSEEECKELVEVMINKGFVPNAKAMMEVLKGRPTAIIRGIMNIVLSKLKN